MALLVLPPARGAVAEQNKVWETQTQKKRLSAWVYRRPVGSSFQSLITDVVLMCHPAGRLDCDANNVARLVRPKITDVGKVGSLSIIEPPPFLFKWRQVVKCKCTHLAAIVAQAPLLGTAIDIGRSNSAQLQELRTQL